MSADNLKRVAIAGFERIFRNFRKPGDEILVERAEPAALTLDEFQEALDVAREAGLHHLDQRSVLRAVMR